MIYSNAVKINKFYVTIYNIINKYNNDHEFCADNNHKDNCK